MQKYAEAGQRALAAGQYAEAQSDFDQLAKLEPNIAEVHATLGLINFKLRNYETAVREIHTAQKLKPGLPRLDSLLGMSLSELGRYNEALPGLEKGFRQSADPEIKRMCGLQLMRAYTGLRKDDDAVRVALDLNRLYANDPEVLYNTGKVYGNYAFLTISRLAQAAPNSVWRHLAAAEAFESQGSYNDAISEYRAVLAIDPERVGIHYRIGRTLLAQSHQTGAQTNNDEARKEFEQELELDPHNGNAAYEIAEMYRRAGDFAQAEQYFERALQDYPGFEEAHLGLAAVYMAQQKPEQALPHLKTAITLNAEDEVSWYRLAEVERALGNKTEQQNALAQFRKLHQVTLDQKTGRLMTSTNEVTKQELDPEAKE
ncbi:MAG TPA: tetratricopeptide repeat protein [Alloacidobacterium sp.]|nr:tetratricopeptide repeat protein [Alloacidobacterium sp.]